MNTNDARMAGQTGQAGQARRGDTVPSVVGGCFRMRGGARVFVCSKDSTGQQRRECSEELNAESPLPDGQRWWCWRSNVWMPDGQSMMTSGPEYDLVERLPDLASTGNAPVAAASVAATPGAAEAPASQEQARPVEVGTPATAEGQRRVAVGHDAGAGSATPRDKHYGYASPYAMPRRLDGPTLFDQPQAQGQAQGQTTQKDANAEWIRRADILTERRYDTPQERIRWLRRQGCALLDKALALELEEAARKRIERAALLDQWAREARAEKNKAQARAQGKAREGSGERSVGNA